MHYLIKLSHGCSFKTEYNGDVRKAVNNYIMETNKGSMKADKIYLIKISKVSEKDFNNSTLWNQSSNLK